MRATLAVIVSTIVLASSSPASGACAWVLWVVPATLDPKVPLVQALVSFNPSYWNPTAAYETAKACGDAESAAKEKEWDHALKRHKSGVSVFNTYAFRCLPDTIDPRGAKGEGSR